MKTDQQYKIGVSEEEDSTANALAMLGTGYEESTVVIEAPRTTTHRRDGKMVEIEEPAWVKFSTGFKKELLTLDEYSLKVFIYIGLSVNWKTGEAYPGVRLIAEDTGMDKGTVVKAVENLENLGFLTIQRRKGTSNIYTPVRYITIGGVRPDRTPTEVSGGNSEVSGENAEVSGASRVNLHNKNNKKEQENTGGEIFKAFQDNIAMLTPMQADKLKDAEKEYPQGWIIEAIGLAVTNNKRNWAYCDAILKRWKSNGKDSGKRIPAVSPVRTL